MERPEIVRLYRAALRALDAAEGAADELRVALAPEDGKRQEPLTLLAHAAAVRLHEGLYWASVELRHKGPLFGDRLRRKPPEA